MKIIHVVGARPNFMKVAPVLAALAEYNGIEQTLVHTGQHYDANMSEIFFKQLGLPEPDINLNIGSASHAVQTANIMIEFEQVVLDQQPNWVVVYGDVNSTVAATLVCAKLNIPVAHVEAGLRSFDRTMPEEVNRLVTDQLATLLLTPSADGDENLLREGIDESKICQVGNVMIDTLVRLLPQAKKRTIISELGLEPHGYGLVTLHRPSNVDEATMLQQIFQILCQISQEIPLIFPIHPRTRIRLKLVNENLLSAINSSNLKLIEPQGYLDFLILQAEARFAITDSGGVQEETTYLGVPCLTIRENTERPITVTLGTNRLVTIDMLQMEVTNILTDNSRVSKIPPLWDGQAGKRIANLLLKD